MAATTTRTRKASAKGVVRATPEDIRRVARDVTDNEVMERQKEMTVFVAGALAGSNIHFLGKPGNGKSMMCRAFCSRIVGARPAWLEIPEQDHSVYFEKAVHAQMPADALIGGYDMPHFAKTGEFKRNVGHSLPNADFAFIDEITRANGPTIDALLPILNVGERAYEANGGMKRTPNRFIATASNFMPDPDDAQLGAFVDRLTLMLDLDYIKSNANFTLMLEKAHERTIGTLDKTVKRETITLAEFADAQEQVQRVAPTPAFLEEYAEFRVAVRNEKLMVSDRRFVELMDVCKAAAWLAGRDELAPADIAACEAGLWRVQDDQPLARKLILPFISSFEQDADKFGVELAGVLDSIEGIRSVVENTPAHEKLPSDTLSAAFGISGTLAALDKRVRERIDAAEKEKAEAAPLRDVYAQVQQAEQWFKDHELPFDFKQ